MAAYDAEVSFKRRWLNLEIRPANEVAPVRHSAGPLASAAPHRLGILRHQEDPCTVSGPFALDDYSNDTLTKHEIGEATGFPIAPRMLSGKNLPAMYGVCSANAVLQPELEHKA